MRQLLALAKLEAAAPLALKAEVEAGALLREVAQLSAAPARIGVSLDPALDALRLQGDRESLHLVLRNLHENAIEHMPEGGSIIWRRLPNGLCVEDEGPGIPEEELPRVTERFFRGRNKSASGSGLGLTIARMAATRVGARIELENRETRPGLRAALMWP
ncbi:MAG: hypothetical protein B7X99_15380 [Rhizobiales bacterium 17-65-6]|nr:MAG: hypothetical protein B7X99_15380 [Rhizobiales bacterium 17-65-6]